MNRQFLPWIKNIMMCLLLLTAGQVAVFSATKPDSLLRVIPKMSENEAKVDNLISVARYFYHRDTDSAMYFYSQAYNLASRLDYKPGMIDALFMESKIYVDGAEFQTARDHIERAVDLAHELGDSLRLARVYFQLAVVQTNMDDYDAALSSSRRSLSIFLSLKDTLGIFANYNSIGSIFKSKSSLDSSAYYYLKAIYLCELKQDETNAAVMFHNLGQVYMMDSLYDVAREYFNKAREINQRINNRARLALNLTDLGRIASADNDLAGAIFYYDQVAEIYNETSDRVGLYNLYNNYGDAYFKQKDYTRAIKYFDMAIQGYQEIGYTRGFICALGNKASVFADNGQYDQALALTDSCLRLSYKEGIIEFRLSYLKNMANTYKKAGDFRNAFDYQDRYYALKDSLFSIEKTRAITSLTLKYEKEKDQARILMLEKENLKRTNQRNATIFAAIGLSLLVLFGMLLLRQRAVKDRIIAEQKVRRLEEEKKLMAAKFLVEGQEEERKRIALELHDGLGVLLSATKMQFTTIKDKSPENRPLIEKATQLLEQATGDVRKISHNMMPGLLTKLGFFEAVEDLFENLNDTEDMVAQCSINGEMERMPENKEIMLYRVIQEMVNNTLKHAQARNILLKIDVRTDRLDVLYTDDGKGFDLKKTMESETESIGLKSIQSRVNFLNGALEMASSPGTGVRYSLKIPLSNEGAA